MFTTNFQSLWGDTSSKKKRMKTWQCIAFWWEEILIGPYNLFYFFPVVMYFFSSSHVLMWELDCKDSWAKDWCFWTVVLEKTLESPLVCKEIKPVHPKGEHSWVFIGRTDVEAETPILWPPDAKNWLIWKDLDAGKDWRQEEKGTTGWDGWMASLTQWT